MAKKKSLGHSPLGFMGEEKMTFDFIPNLNETLVREVEHPHKGQDECIQTHIEESDKTVVSYYLEKSIVRKIKELAHTTEQSYSSVAGHAFTYYLQKQGLY